MTILCLMNATTTIFDDKPILHIQSKIHSNLNTRTLSFVPKQSTVCICTHTAHLAPFLALFVIYIYIIHTHYGLAGRRLTSHARAKLHNNFFNVAYNLRYHFILLLIPKKYHTLLCIVVQLNKLYSTLLYSTLLYSTLLYSTLLYSTLLYSTLLYSTLLYSTLLYSTLLYSTLLYSTHHSCAQTPRQPLRITRGRQATILIVCVFTNPLN